MSNSSSSSREDNMVRYVVIALAAFAVGFGVNYLSGLWSKPNQGVIEGCPKTPEKEQASSEEMSEVIDKINSFLQKINEIGKSIENHFENNSKSEDNSKNSEEDESGYTNIKAIDKSQKNEQELKDEANSKYEEIIRVINEYIIPFMRNEKRNNNDINSVKSVSTTVTTTENMDWKELNEKIDDKIQKLDSLSQIVSQIKRCSEGRKPSSLRT